MVGRLIKLSVVLLFASGVFAQTPTTESRILPISYCGKVREEAILMPTSIAKRFAELDTMTGFDKRFVLRTSTGGDTVTVSVLKTSRMAPTKGVSTSSTGSTVFVSATSDRSWYPMFRLDGQNFLFSEGEDLQADVEVFNRFLKSVKFLHLDDANIRVIAELFLAGQGYFRNSHRLVIVENDDVGSIRSNSQSTVRDVLKNRLHKKIDASDTGIYILTLHTWDDSNKTVKEWEFSINAKTGFRINSSDVLVETPK